MYIYLCVIKCIYMFSCAKYVQVIHVTCSLPCRITNYQGQMNMYFTRVHLNGHQLSSLHLFEKAKLEVECEVGQVTL